MYIVLFVAPLNESVALTITGWAKVPSPLLSVFIDAVAKVFQDITPAGVTLT